MNTEANTVTVNPETATPNEPQYMQDLRRVYALALSNTDFTGDKKRVEKAIAALTLPDPETRVKAQLRANAEKALFAEAAKKAMNNGGNFSPPSGEAIDARVEAGLLSWRRKQGL